MMARMKCVIAYDGSAFSGYQIQPDKRTVAGELEKVLKKMHKGESVRIQGSGRTDTGVHAKGQVIHFDTALQIPEESWKRALNSLLPDDIYIKDVKKAEEGFHARYDAKSKEYRYYVQTTPEPDVFKRKYVCHFPYELNMEAMEKAAAYLKGTHDFTAFSSVKATVKGSRVRTLYELSCKSYDEGIYFVFHGDGFLYNMVRIIAGFLLDAGRGKRKPEEIPALFEAKDRSKVGLTAPPEGLYLYKVIY